jgi:hypothetical protein
MDRASLKYVTLKTVFLVAKPLPNGGPNSMLYHMRRYLLIREGGGPSGTRARLFGEEPDA